MKREQEQTGTDAVHDSDAPYVNAEPVNAVPSVAPVVLPDLAPVLLEVAGTTGSLLWHARRDVLTWAAAPEAERANVFHRGAALTRRAGLDRVVLHPELSVPLGVLAGLVADPAGSKPLPLLVMHSCLRLARHLCDRGAALSALAFAQAAALASPDHPRPVLEVGRLLGPARALDARSTLVRALELSRERAAQEQHAEPELCAAIHAELAALAFRRREPRAARGHLLTAARAARHEARRAGC
jgi:hypothetical protein